MFKKGWMKSHHPWMHAIHKGAQTLERWAANGKSIGVPYSEHLGHTAQAINTTYKGMKGLFKMGHWINEERKKKNQGLFSKQGLLGFGKSLLQNKDILRNTSQWIANQTGLGIRPIHGPVQLNTKQRRLNSDVGNHTPNQRGEFGGLSQGQTGTSGRLPQGTPVKQTVGF
jgi:hypothetical protein